uniref:Uncharacterized protein n=1 Tax=Phlebotomus papatasi TaxID=29031 RepID=A0A1B0CZM3_PHLPP
MKIFVVLVAFLAFSVTESLIAPENFVINGLNATVTPHHVIVEFFNAANLGFFGGGSIITSNHILTSAQNVHTYFSCIARVRPIALPPAGLDLPFQNEQGMILGFGFTDGVTNQPADNLRYGYVRVQPDNFCTSIFHIVIPNHFCATDNRFPVNICNGDIGGGFTTFYRSEEILVGVSSMLIENCHIQWPSAYTRVSQYLPWIHQVIGV